jgi:hypothetical protein
MSSRRRVRITENAGFIVLGVFLIVWGLVTLFALPIPSAILAILAIAAGLLVLVKR